ncbi:dienelactone hydrolase family protein [Granulicella tundricola]|uniref:Carboxymethylenebutenolidase n=1 Tax=Granulicella tundricola (strain ATCC BAA-1859 / DSM 23138 / MP5ACTX9) TaxID=1198114 RepID=E8X3U6_GRATM|nr:dienelactone hydrolase family protein [Granulicella tundricola]ADW69374.1 Carboxymethylenebutenolidase [Granulicella tundricola MP5ACTX9]
MGMIKITAADGHELGAYVAAPDKPIGAVVVVQEIFGVNKSIRGVADDFAKAGYLAIAPALFDRYERDLELTYVGEDLQKAFGLYGKLSPDTALLDIAAAFKEVEKTVEGVAVMGFCYGGLMSWLSATRAEKLGIDPACTVGFYAGGVGSVATEEPTCPVMLHFGLADSHIGADQREAVKAAHPEVKVYEYEGAGHGFFNVDRADYAPEQAKLAWERTLEFLKENLA